MNQCLDIAVRDMANRWAHGEVPQGFDLNEIHEQGSETAARHIVTMLDGDSSHQAYLDEQRDLVGRPTTKLTFNNGENIDTRSMGSYGLHRQRNNRLKPDNTSYQPDTKRPALDDLDLNRRQAPSAGFPPAAFNIGPFSTSNENGSAAKSSSSSTPAGAISTYSSFSFGSSSGSTSHSLGSSTLGHKDTSMLPTSSASMPFGYGGHSSDTSMIDLTEEESNDPVVLQMLELLLELSMQESGAAGVLVDENAGSPVVNKKAARRVQHLLEHQDTAYMFVEQALKRNQTATPECVARFYDVLRGDV